MDVSLGHSWHHDTHRSSYHTCTLVQIVAPVFVCRLSIDSIKCGVGRTSLLWALCELAGSGVSDCQRFAAFMCVFFLLNRSLLLRVRVSLFLLPGSRFLSS
jgi:hypothetical protein